MLNFWYLQLASVYEWVVSTLRHTIMHRVSLNNNCEEKCDHTIVAAMGVPQVYTLSSSHIYCIKLFNAPDWGLGKSGSCIGVHLLSTQLFHALYQGLGKSWKLYGTLWESYCISEKFMCDEVHSTPEQHWPQVTAGMQMHVQMHACTYVCLWMHVHMQACLHECMSACMYVCMTNDL